jgi:intein/homing endonuclease
MTQENENYIVKNYHKKETKYILEKLNISKPTLLRVVKKHNIKIKSSKKYMVTLALNSKIFSKYLIDKGCYPRKTYTIKFPYFLEANLIRHFIRGYFDGDGSISASIRRRYNGEISDKKANVLNFVSGSDEMLISLGEIISANCKTKPRKLYKYGTNKFGYIAWFTNDDIKKIYHYFYDNSTIYLDRKKEKYEEILKTC